jgi:hypothetical protein
VDAQHQAIAQSPSVATKTKKTMNYKEARKYIDNGDMIAVRTAHNWINRATQFFTRSPYTHAGLAIWIDGGLYIAELNGGRNHLTPMSQLEDLDFDVFKKPGCVENVRANIFKWLRKPIEYAYASFIVIGLLNWLKIKTFVRWRKMLVCSGWCVAVYEDSGWGEHSRILSPGDLANLLELKFEIRASKKF